jgi:hypothetical protein
VLVVAGCSSNETAHADGGTDVRDAARDSVVVDTVIPADIVFGAPDGTDVTVDDGTGADASADVAVDVPVVIGPHEGTVDRLRFAVYGDIRPPYPDQNSAYPQMVFGDVMQSIEETGVQFAIATGDYMNANFCSSCVDTQLDYLTMAERRFSGHVFHSLGNHECATVTSYNCDAENETVNIRTFKTRMLAEYDHTYYDFRIHTSTGDAHFIATAPNAWNDGQAAWLTSVLAQPAAYTFVIAHEPPSDPGPGTSAIEDAMMLRAGGISMRFYGHVHEYSRYGFNATVTGNAGAPLSGSSYYGFIVVEQRDDGNLVVNAYEASHPPIVRDSFVVQPDGSPGR